jgi:hypothetical protein
MIWWLAIDRPSEVPRTVRDSPTHIGSDRLPAVLDGRSVAAVRTPGTADPARWEEVT